MIITEKTMKVFLLDSKNPLSDMLKSRDERFRISNKSSVIPIYCYRYIGVEDNQTNYLCKLKDLETNLKKTSHQYLKITKGLTTSSTREEIVMAENIWEQFTQWESSGERSYIELYNIKWNTNSSHTALNWTIKRNLLKIIEIFEDIENNKNQSIRKNFGISIILWINTYLSCLFPNEMSGNHIPKFIFWGAIRRNEVYFSIFLSMLGCDIIYINPANDTEFTRIDPQYTYTKKIEYDKKSEIADFPKPEEKISDNNISDVVQKRSTPSIPSAHPSHVIKRQVPPIPGESAQIERSYEDLARLSASIVMINVYDDDHSHCGSGSGVIIDEDGTIVTNYHVIEDGSIFGIVFENDKTEHITRTVICRKGKKDLALLKIDQKTLPIPIKSSDTLKRGQQIVAIGSPLGLMNTISDGIIAGFRSFDDQDFIQITAPISPGSSGGALLDRYGALVGITSGGYTKGQNLNLAIPSSEITKLLFVASLKRPRRKSVDPSLVIC